MFRLLVLADDFTGALDTGVQFSMHGIPTLVSDSPSLPDKNLNGEEVLVLNMKTRHDGAGAAYEKIRSVSVRARELQVGALYVKTDSGLRGNVGASLEAALTAWGGNLAFVPAYPQAGRLVQGGKLVINGVPVTQSIFGRDLYNPVRHDGVRDILAEQTACPVLDGNGTHPNSGAILLYEAQDEAQMERIAAAVTGLTDIGAYAGCAGFAGYLPEVLKIPGKEKKHPDVRGPVLFLSGSTSATTLEQMRVAREAGIPSILFRGILEETPDFAAVTGELETALKNGHAMLECARDEQGVQALTQAALARGLNIQETGERIAANFGGAARQLLARGFEGILCVIGGDTLSGVMRALGAHAVHPLTQLNNGVVLSEVSQNGNGFHFVTKSGSFGDSGEALRILDRLRELGGATWEATCHECRRLSTEEAALMN